MNKKRFIINLVMIEIAIFILALSLTVLIFSKNIGDETFESLNFSKNVIVNSIKNNELNDNGSLDKELKEIFNNQKNTYYAIYSKSGDIISINTSNLNIFSSTLSEEEMKKINSQKLFKDRKRISITQYYYVFSSIDIEADKTAYILICKTANIFAKRILFVLFQYILILIVLALILYYLQKHYNQFTNMRMLTRVKLANNAVLSKSSKSIDLTKIDASKDEKIILSEINKINTNINKQIALYEAERKKNVFIIDHMAQTLFGINKNNNIVLSNETARRIFKDHSNSGQDVINLFLEQDKNEVLDIIKQGIATRREYLIQSQFYRVEFIFLNNININDIKYFMLLTNIDELKNDQKNKNEFFANASHELKTPLTAILGYSEVIDSSHDQKLVHECNKEITLNATRMVQLIRLMLDYARIDSNSDILKAREDIDLRDLSVQILKNNKYQIKQKNISVNILGNAQINANKINIELMLGNLIENSIKYNKQNGLVNIELYENTKGIIINVIDSGIGIPDEEKANIFKTFYKINKTKKDNFSSGLGLGIVKKVVDLYGGNIACNNNEYGGVTFKVEFLKH